MEMVTGLVPNDEHVSKAAKALQAAGFSDDQVKVIHQARDVWQWLNGREKLRVVFKYAFTGALLGLAVGCLYGIPAGLMNCSQMGCSSTLSLILLAIISLYWVLGGALLGGVVGVDQLEHPLYSYVEGVRRGEALFLIETGPERMEEARRILGREAGTCISCVDRE